MSWFTFNVGELAKSALSEAQKKIDKALDIEAKNEAQDKESEPPRISSQNQTKLENTSQHGLKKNQARTKKDSLVGSKVKKSQSKETDDFFAAWENENPGVKESPRSKQSQNKNKYSISPSNREVPPAPKDDDIGKLVMSDSDIEVITPRGHVHDDAVLSDQSNHENKTQTSYNIFTEVPLTEYDDHKQEVLSNPNGTQLDAINISPNSSIQKDIDSRDNIMSALEQNDIEQSYVVEQPCSNNTASTPSTTPVQYDMFVTSTTEPSILLPIAISDVDDTDVHARPTKISYEDSVSKTDDGSSVALKYGTDAEEATGCVVPALKDVSQEVSQSIDSAGTTADEIAENILAKSADADLHYTQVSTAKGEAAADQVAQRTDNNYLALAEKMEVYEHQLMTLSQRNASLNEENDNLKSEISRMQEESKRKSDEERTDAENSIKSYETTCKILEEEKANLVKQFNVLKSQLAARMTHEQVQNAIAEKEESIKGLMEEGEVLAKKQLQQNNLIKKLKSQAQERESELKSLREKVEHYEMENSKLKEELKIARGQGKEQRETSMRISDAYEQRERETQILQEKLAQSEEKQRTLQVNLDGAYKEIGDLHKQIAEQESKLSSEWEAKESDIIRAHELDKKKVISDQEHHRQLLMIQILELTNSISRAETNAARKDDGHRREVKELQQRIQESEGRNQDLSDNVTSVTRPLLRQIENLQATHSTQQRSWNALEKTLHYRLAEAQTDLMAARESERLAQSMSIEAKSKVQALEKQIENNTKTISKQEQEINSIKTQLEQRKVELQETMVQLDKLNATHKETLHKSRKERLFLENQLQMEKVRSETERKKHATQLELFQKEKLTWSRSEITSVSSNQIADTESVSSIGDAFHGTDEGQISSSSLPGLTNQLSFEGGRAVSMSNVLENLQTQVKLKEGEIAQLRGEINMLERTRSSMAEEIVRLTNLNEDMEGVSQELQDTRVKLSDVEGRYSAILTMYGEKEEENEELKMDLADVKAMYRQQIDDLLKADTS